MQWMVTIFLIFTERNALLQGIHFERHNYKEVNELYFTGPIQIMHNLSFNNHIIIKICIAKRKVTLCLSFKEMESQIPYLIILHSIPMHSEYMSNIHKI